MAASVPSIMPLQTVFEARYRRGYRYLDRCGEVMVLLEEGLPDICGGKVWMAQEHVPTGAKMICPDYDITLVFDTTRLCVDQHPAKTECPLEDISRYALQVLMSKLQIGDVFRFGRRVKRLLPTDSIDRAHKMSVAKGPLGTWAPQMLDDMRVISCRLAVEWEDDSNMIGARLEVGPVYKVDAPLTIDPRLRQKPHLLPERQREALVAQYRRRKQTQTDPDAGLVVDVDYWWLDPVAEKLPVFFKAADEKTDELVHRFQRGGK